jgi:hypothetical protein
MVTGGKQRTHFTILCEPNAALKRNSISMNFVIVALNRIAAPPNRSPPTPNSDNKVHRA